MSMAPMDRNQIIHSRPVNPFLTCISKQWEFLSCRPAAQWSSFPYKWVWGSDVVSEGSFDGLLVVMQDNQNDIIHIYLFIVNCLYFL